MTAVNCNLEMWKEATVACFTALQNCFLRAFEKPEIILGDFFHCVFLISRYVVLSDKHKYIDLVHLVFIRYCHMFRLSISAITGSNGLYRSSLESYLIYRICSRNFRPRVFCAP